MLVNELLMKCFKCRPFLSKKKEKIKGKQSKEVHICPVNEVLQV